VLKLKVIIGSTRDGRSADLVAPWVIDRARAHGGFDVEVLDLRDWPLPMFAETFATIGDFADPTYSDPIVKRWNERIKDGDVFLFITPEYNHSVPAVLKNAIDNVFVSYGFRNKAALFVGYSVGQVAAARAVEHLAHMAVEAELVPLRNTVLIPKVQDAFENGAPREPMTETSLRVAFEDLEWWGTTLRKARVEGALPPAPVRVQAALAAAAD
jgi:NAD(P)H-dependent FMN reductase